VICHVAIVPEEVRRLRSGAKRVAKKERDRRNRVRIVMRYVKPDRLRTRCLQASTKSGERSKGSGQSHYAGVTPRATKQCE